MWQVHCGTCRNLERGRGWRESVVRFFDLPNNVADFDCPLGRPWGWQPVTDSLDAEPSTVQKVAHIVKAPLRFGRALIQRVSVEQRDRRLAICHACPEVHDGVCGELLRLTRHACGCMVNIKAWGQHEHCPQGKW